MTEILIGAGLSEELVATLQLPLLGRLLLAAVLGGAIGAERELSGKAAGLRTNLLICVGAALLTELSVALALMGSAPGAGDPSRIAAQIVSGIGFLGAGTIIQSRGSITGLTSAATIWVVAAIGMATGARAYVMAIGSTVLVVAVLLVLGRIEDRLFDRRGRRRYLLILRPAPDIVAKIEGLFREEGMKVRNTSIDKGEYGFEAQLDVEGSRRAHEAVAGRLIAHEDVLRTSRAG